MDAGELRRAYRESITAIPSSIVGRKIVDDLIAEESCLVCGESWDIGDEVVTLKCECRYWAHEACLGKSVFMTGCYPTCRTPTYLLDDKMVLLDATIKGDTVRVKQLLEKGTPHLP